jgi:streptogramin lyase
MRCVPLGLLAVTSLVQVFFPAVPSTPSVAAELAEHHSLLGSDVEKIDWDDVERRQAEYEGMAHAALPEGFNIHDVIPDWDGNLWFVTGGNLLGYRDQGTGEFFTYEP